MKINHDDDTLLAKIAALESDNTQMKSDIANLRLKAHRECTGSYEFNREIGNKIHEIEKKVGSLHSRIAKHSTILNEHEFIIDDKKALSHLRSFKKEIMEMHSLLGEMVTKICTLTEVSGYCGEVYPDLHIKVISKLIESMDYPSAWWSSVRILTIEQVLMKIFGLIKEDIDKENARELNTSH